MSVLIMFCLRREGGKKGKEEESVRERGGRVRAMKEASDIYVLPWEQHPTSSKATAIIMKFTWKQK